jgi:hypothetical protein
MGSFHFTKELHKMEGSLDNKVLGLFTVFLIALAAVFGSGAVKNIGVPSSANLLSSSPPQGNSVVGSPTISADFINQMLTKYGSPAAGTAQDLYTLGQQYGVDPAFALAVFWNESNFGKSGEAVYTRSLGNLRPVPDEAFERDGYAAFYTWQDGYRAFYKLIAGPLYVGGGLSTPEAIIPRYAPSGDNNSPSHYIAVVESAMSLWRSGKVGVPA